MPYTSRLLYPKYLQFRNTINRKQNMTFLKGLLLLVFGMLFWAAIFIIFYRVLFYFKGIDVFGDFLAAKLLSMVFLTFFAILIFSNIITSLSSFFMSEELQLIIASPYDFDELYYAKIIETIVNSSWMVLLFSLPVFLSYGIIFKQSVFYYIVLLGTVVPFLMICSCIGICVALMLVTVFPAKRLKDVLFILSVFLIIGMYFFFRFLRPERLVDPDSFFTVVDYLTSLQTPTSPLLPSQWATDVLAALLFKQGAHELVFNVMLLWSTALAFVVLLNWLSGRLYFNAWSKSQDARMATITRYRLFNRFLNIVLRPFSVQIKAIIEKDIRVFFRDTSQWSQLFLLIAIIFIYLYNFSVLPLDKSPIPTRQLQNLFSFLNMGLAGFVIAAVAVRFAYPAISLEGESFWIVKSSPLGLNGLLWCKFWVNLFFLVVLAEILIVCSNIFLRVDRFMMLLSTATVFCMTFGLTSMSIGFGATYPRFRYENIAQIPTGFGGLLYMITSVLYVGTIVVLEAWPVHIVLMSRMLGRTITSMQSVQIACAFILIIVISVGAFFIPMKIGQKKLAQNEEI